MDRSDRRLFFALWPDAQTVRLLAQWRAAAHEHFGGRPMRADTLHLTLAFLGMVDGERIPALLQLLQADSGWLGGTLRLDHFGHFRGPRIVWAGSSGPVDWLERLRRNLWDALTALGFSEPDEPFRAHVSLLRKAGDGTLATLPPPQPVTWEARELVLVGSAPRESGSYYTVLGAQTLPLA